MHKENFHLRPRSPGPSLQQPVRFWRPPDGLPEAYLNRSLNAILKKPVGGAQQGPTRVGSVDILRKRQRCFKRYRLKLNPSSRAWASAAANRQVGGSPRCFL